jgi:hypothetical protein
VLRLIRICAGKEPFAPDAFTRNVVVSVKISAAAPDGRVIIPRPGSPVARVAVFAPRAKDIRPPDAHFGHVPGNRLERKPGPLPLLYFGFDIIGSIYLFSPGFHIFDYLTIVML